MNSMNNISKHVPSDNLIDIKEEDVGTGGTHGTKRQRQEISTTDSGNDSKEKKTMPGKEGDCPLFLRKTYVMVDTCDVSVAQWSDDGKSFVIKDPDKFATDIIPQFFKHNNLQSFVRQLNFYGFRKIKLNSIKLNPLNNKQSKHLRFRHDKFIRGKPELLHLIPKPRQNASSNDQKEVEALKTEVKGLKETMSSMADEITSLKDIATTLMQKIDQSLTRDREYEEASKMESEMKKPRVEQCLSSNPLLLSTSVQSSDPLNINFAPHATRPPSIISIEEPQVPPAASRARRRSIDRNSFSNISIRDIDEIWPDSLEDVDNDQEIMDLLLTDIVEDRETTLQPECVGPISTALVNENTSASVKTKLNDIGPEYVRKLHHSIGILPEDVRHMFTVEQLFANITEPDCLKKQVDALFVLASDMGKQPEKRPSVKGIPSPHYKRISSHAA